MNDIYFVHLAGVVGVTSDLIKGLNRQNTKTDCCWLLLSVIIYSILLLLWFLLFGGVGVLFVVKCYCFDSELDYCDEQKLLVCFLLLFVRRAKKLQCRKFFSSWF